VSKSLKVKAEPTAVEKVLKQNLRMVVIYENKPRPAARGRSQKTASEECKNFNNYQYVVVLCLRQHQQQCTKHVLT